MKIKFWVRSGACAELTPSNKDDGIRLLELLVDCPEVIEAQLLNGCGHVVAANMQAHREHVAHDNRPVGDCSNGLTGGQCFS